MKDILIPIVFPEYKITVDIPRLDVDLLPWTSVDNFTIPKSSQKFSGLGHAGILIVNGVSGLTKYYEYGRYDYRDLDFYPESNKLVIENVGEFFR